MVVQPLAPDLLVQALALLWEEKTKKKLLLLQKKMKKLKSPVSTYRWTLPL